jgi:hypothetical protein
MSVIDWVIKNKKYKKAPETVEDLLELGDIAGALLLSIKQCRDDEERDTYFNPELMDDSAAILWATGDYETSVLVSWAAKLTRNPAFSVER